ncbi:hypothetical protein [Jannaschia pohangensis]|uniref:hypothetical protein n=1 Tax=Jannaschia pohangensis TaxID=390807 RepID=UPI0011142CFC|nr:hypothetical protein [Jannaschia pohangensis]
MTFILISLKDGLHDLQLRNIVWRPVASEIVRAEIVDGERGQMLAYHLCTQVTAPEAAAICEHLTRLVNNNALPKDIDEETAKLVATFAASSSGFEVC